MYSSLVKAVIAVKYNHSILYIYFINKDEAIFAVVKKYIYLYI